MDQTDQKNRSHSLLNPDAFSWEEPFRWGLNVLNILGILLTLYGLYWGFQNQVFTSEVALRNLLDSFGFFAPIVFIGIQIIQTVVPIIPGALTIPMGVVIFGMGNGFWLNFIGILIGSVINFLLAKKYGRPLVELLVDRKHYEKYISWLDNEKRFERLFIFGMFFPISPDDILCYIAGLSNLSFSRYLVILTLGKPIPLMIYSVGMLNLLEWLFQLFA